MAITSNPESPVRQEQRAYPTLYQFFGPKGMLSAAHPNYEFRRGQLQMAEAVQGHPVS